MNEKEISGSEKAVESGSESGKGRFGRMMEKGGEMLSGLYEKAKSKSSEVVQNAVDKVSIWTNSSFSKWYEGFVSEYKFRAAEHSKKQEQLLTNAYENAKAVEALAGLGADVDEKIVDRARRESERLGDRAEKEYREAAKEQRRAVEAEEKVAAFKEKAEFARERIAGRIDGKIISHRENIGSIQVAIDRADTNIADAGDKIKSYNAKIEEAGQIAGGVKNKDLLSLREKVVEELEKRKKEQQKIIDRNEKLKKKDSERKKTLEEKIGLLQTKRDGIFGKETRSEERREGEPEKRERPAMTERSEDEKKPDRGGAVSPEEEAPMEGANALAKDLEENPDLFAAAKMIVSAAEAGAVGAGEMASFLIYGLSGFSKEDYEDIFSKLISEYENSLRDRFGSGPEAIMSGKLKSVDKIKESVGRLAEVVAEKKSQ